MNIVGEYGNDDLAKVYVAQIRNGGNQERISKGNLIEFVESLQPPIPREKKWVLIVSSMIGCPIRCKMCDAGGDFNGKLTVDEILAQIQYVVNRRFPDGVVPIPKFKIQFARMGEPSLNPAVLDAIDRLPSLFNAPGLHVSLSTIAPNNKIAKDFFEQLIAIKNRHYSDGRFQLQYSIHTTDLRKRDELIPINKLSFEEIALYGKRFSNPRMGDRKITLNFAPAVDYPINASVVREYFDPDFFLIKITPLNPTVRSHEESMQSAIDPYNKASSEAIVKSFRDEGFNVVLSIGETEENRIGSNCGQYIQRALQARNKPQKSYELEQYRVGNSAT